MFYIFAITRFACVAGWALRALIAWFAYKRSDVSISMSKFFETVAVYLSSQGFPEGQEDRCRRVGRRDQVELKLKRLRPG